MTDEIKLYEILVPTVSNEGKPFRTRYHKVWDKKILEIAGGLTVLRPAKGQWVSGSGDLYLDRTIPVRIACTRDQIMEICKHTAKYYDQIVIMAYQISEEVFFIGPDGKNAS